MILPGTTVLIEIFNSVQVVSIEMTNLVVVLYLSILLQNT